MFVEPELVEKIRLLRERVESASFSGRFGVSSN